MRKYFVVESGEYTGKDWLLAFGTDQDGKDYFITTNHIHGSELPEFSGGARFDAELVCGLLNKHYNKIEKERNVRDT